MSNFMPATTDQSFLPFQYEGMHLQEACFINGEPYFTRRVIGEFLEYTKPQEAIDKIIKRNPYIDDPRWSVHPSLGCTEGVAVDLKLRSTDGKEYNTRVFNPIGLQLIIFESRQPKAIQYKVAVAHLVYAFMQGRIKPKVWSPDRISAIKQILSESHAFKRGKMVKELAQREAAGIKTVYKWIGKYGELKTRAGKKKKTRSTAGITKYPELKARALEIKAQNPTYGPRKISAIIGHPKAYRESVKRWISAA